MCKFAAKWNQKKFYEKSLLATGDSFTFLFIQTVLQNYNNLTCCVCSSLLWSVFMLWLCAALSLATQPAFAYRRSRWSKPQKTKLFCTVVKWWNVVGARRSFHPPAEDRLPLSAGHSPRRPSEMLTKVECGENRLRTSQNTYVPTKMMIILAW